jgi:hypothetical protein
MVARDKNGKRTKVKRDDDLFGEKWLNLLADQLKVGLSMR